MCLIRPALSCWWFFLWFIRQSVGYTRFSLCTYHAVKPNGWDAYDGNYSNTIQLNTCERCWIEGTTPNGIHWKRSIRKIMRRSFVQFGSLLRRKILNFSNCTVNDSSIHGFNSKCKTHWIKIIIIMIIIRVIQPIHRISVSAASYILRVCAQFAWCLSSCSHEVSTWNPTALLSPVARNMAKFTFIAFQLKYCHFPWIWFNSPSFHQLYRLEVKYCCA